MELLLSGRARPTAPVWDAQQIFKGLQLHCARHELDIKASPAGNFFVSAGFAIQVR